MNQVSPRLAAILIALFMPCGAGHFYLGLVRRGLLWAAATNLGLVLMSFLMVSSSHVVRIGGLVAYLGTVAVLWMGPIIDLSWLRPGRFGRASLRTVVALMLAVLAGEVAVRTCVRAYVVEAFKIPSGSMWPTLHLRDHIFVDKWGDNAKGPLAQRRIGMGGLPTRGEVFVFEYPDSDAEAPRVDYVKRVIAIPGDTLEVEDGHPIINGWRVPSCRVGTFELGPDSAHMARGELYVEFLGENAYPIWLEAEHVSQRQGPYVVQPNESWVLGDNRNNAADSRVFNHGLGGGVPDDNLTGRALFIWLAFDNAGVVDASRIGLDVHGLAGAPRGAPTEIAAGLEKCLAQRPAQTIPPRRAPLGT